MTAETKEILARIDERLMHISKTLDMHDERTQDNGKNIILMQESLRQINTHLMGDGLNQKGVVKRLELLEDTKKWAVGFVAAVASVVGFVVSISADFITRKLGG